MCLRRPRAALAAGGITLNGPDHLFFLDDATKQRLRDTLVAVGSSYPFDGGAALADMGVVTHPERRGKGHARSVVYALSRGALAVGYEPQYRCQTDNTASVKLAQGSGFVSIGTWDVPLPVGADE